MNSNTKRRGLVGVITALAVLIPTPAFAEAPSGPEILLPKMAEFIPALIAFLIIWVVAAKFVWPSVLGMMDQRQQKIQGDLDAAAAEKASAVKEHQEYQAQIANAQDEVDEIIAEAKAQAEAERARILAKAQEEAAATVAKARDAVSSERRKALAELSDSVIDLSVEIAGKIIGNSLSDSDQRKLAEKYLVEVGGGHDSDA
ncbi:MAG: F0F1 ATP synthase subunit B [Parolsenella sp.]|uniref:F0F1 ATP synthase subunit B n=1 Tax=unclassified Parolsenella TaxID=2623992 RepID=UPI002A7490B4|nr:F0F1 ATP synthase subunit B [Parolsenella sp.]MCI5950267.1 F0F1 ATP synthase subunit B [Coriobacteriaceae bacterium]MDY3292557.1 F0F1 ATP synthase subunit B [Parolsenella sp.]